MFKKIKKAIASAFRAYRVRRYRREILAARAHLHRWFVSYEGPVGHWQRNRLYYQVRLDRENRLSMPGGAMARAFINDWLKSK
jgi:hypothetical protein